MRGMGMEKWWHRVIHGPRNVALIYRSEPKPGRPHDPVARTETCPCGKSWRHRGVGPTRPGWIQVVDESFTG